MIVSEGSTGEKRAFPYELVLEDFARFLEPGYEAVIAHREGREIRVQLGHREKAKRHDRYFPAGTPKVFFRIKEGNTVGRAEIYLEPDAINLYLIRTEGKKRNMPKGAGTIFLDWLATQAALQGKNFNIIRVENPRIFHIVARNRLVEPQNTCVEACLWTPSSYRVAEEGIWGDPDFLEQYMDGEGHFLNIRGKPSPHLLPPP